MTEKLKKKLALSIVCMMVISLFGSNFAFAQEGIAVPQTKVNIITSAEQLPNDIVKGEVYELGADITLPSGKQMGSIAGTLDGKGHTITLADKPLTSIVSGTIQNLGVTSTQSISNPGWDPFGSIAVTLQGGKIINSFSTASVNSFFDSAGGLVGRSENGLIENCYYGGNLEGSGYGGLVGQALTASQPTIINNSYYQFDGEAKIKVVCTGDNYKLDGVNKKSSVEMKTENTVNLLNTGIHNTGFKWEFKEGSYPVLKKSGSAYDPAFETAKDELKKVINIAKNKVKKEYTQESWEKFEVAKQSAENEFSNPEATTESINKVKEALQAAMNQLEVFKITEAIAPPAEKDIIKITKASQLENGTEEGKFYQLQNDIEYSGGTGICSGVFDGNGYTVKLNGTPMFDMVDTYGVVQNVQFEGTVNDYNGKGPLGSYIKGYVLNCASAVKGENATGFATRINGGVLANCIAYGGAQKGAIVKQYGYNANNGSTYRGELYSTYWIQGKNDPVITAEDLKNGSKAKTEKEMQTKEMVSILNKNKGTHGAQWGQNGKTGFPYFGADQEFNPDTGNLPDSKYTVKFGKNKETAVEIKNKKLIISPDDARPEDFYIVGKFYLEGVDPHRVTWSIEDIKPDRILMINQDDGGLRVDGEGEAIVKAQVDGKDTAWIKVIAHASKIEDIKLFINGKDVTGKDYTVQGSEWSKIFVKARYAGEKEYVDVNRASFIYAPDNYDLVRSTPNSNEFAFEKPGTSKITVTSKKDTNVKAFINVTSEYVPVERVEQTIGGIYVIHGLNANAWERKAYNPIRAGISVFPDNASNKHSFSITSNNLEVGDVLDVTEATDYIPYRAGKAVYTLTLKDTAPNGDVNTLTDKKEVEFVYKNPITQIKAPKNIEVEAYTEKPLNLDFIGTIDKDNWSISEAEMTWTYDKEGIARVYRNGDGYWKKGDGFSTTAPDYGFFVGDTNYIIKGLKKGEVTITGTPVDQTNHPDPVVIKVKVTDGVAPEVDIQGFVTEAKTVAINFIKDLHTTTPYEFGNEWDLYGLLRAGEAIPEGSLNGYYDSIVKEVKFWSETTKPTDIARTVLTLSLMEKDITNVDGVNLAALLYNNKKLTAGSNELSWALIALDACNTEIPKDARWTRSNILNELLTWQNPDGGFPLNKGFGSGIDTTAMVLQALAKYQDLEPVADSIEKGLKYMENAIKPDYDGKTSEATAQIIITLSVLGRDAGNDPQFSEGPESLIMSLKKYYVENKGFSHEKSVLKVNQMATIQALQALDAHDRFTKGERGYWDISGERTDIPEINVKPVKPVEPVEPSKPVKPVEPVEPSKPLNPSNPADADNSGSFGNNRYQNAHITAVADKKTEKPKKKDKLKQTGNKKYDILNGKDQVIPADFEGVISIRVDADINDFINVEIDGKEIDSKYYTVSRGSTIITFSKDYIKSLKDGQYSVKINFTGGFAETTLTIGNVENSANSDVAANYSVDSDNSSSMLFIGLGIILIIVVVGFIYYKKRKQ